VNDIHPRTTGPRRENIDVERLKSSIRLSDIVSRYTELRQSGRSRIGLCPFHADTDPSFVVTDELGVFYCHGCRASGDVIDFVRAIQRIGFVDAVRYISGAIPAFTIPYERERARKLDRAKRALAGAYARCQWNDAKAIEGTPAERYLRAGNHMRAPVHAALRHRADLDRPIDRPEKPDLQGRIARVQRIFLEPDGTRAPLPRPKLSLGAIKGGALRLGPVAPEWWCAKVPRTDLRCTRCIQGPRSGLHSDLGTCPSSSSRPA
jgi:hypothetical protein